MVTKEHRILPAKRMMYTAFRKASTRRGTLANCSRTSVRMLEEAEDKVGASEL